jgi:redox-sensitive bicupin YhaK (pirin superfamily)
MITVRKSEDRGHAIHGWLDSYHTFSFADYHDKNWMGFRDLRVINQDKVLSGEGFETHGHKNMEIVTYVYEGALEHKDSMGTGSVLRPGDVQRMSAGTGVTHSEFNHSKDQNLQLLQIWILPKKEGIKPGYEEKNFKPETKKNNLKLIVSPEGKDGSLKINQDASIYAALIDQDTVLTHSLNYGRGAWVQVVKGTVDLNGEILNSGDGAAIENEKELKFLAKDNAEILLFDLN